VGCGQVAEPGRTLRPDLKVSFVTGYAENATLGNGHLDPGMKVIGRSFPGAGVQKIAGTKLVVMRCNAPLTFGKLLVIALPNWARSVDCGWLNAFSIR
jgi:hypothetical protein